MEEVEVMAGEEVIINIMVKKDLEVEVKIEIMDMMDMEDHIETKMYNLFIIFAIIKKIFNII